MPKLRVNTLLLIIILIAPYNVGPGAYGGSKFKHIKEPSPKKDSSGMAILLSQQ
jgi:hypothetical protein